MGGPCRQTTTASDPLNEIRNRDSHIPYPAHLARVTPARPGDI